MISELLEALLHEVAPDTGVHVHILTLQNQILTNGGKMYFFKDNFYSCEAVTISVCSVQPPALENV